MTIRRGPNAVDVKSQQRAVRGFLSKAKGAHFEDEIELACDVYRRKGLGIFTRNFPPVAGAPGRMRFTGLGPVDFTGHWCGVPVAFDCKRTDDLRLSFSFPPAKRHQAQFLADFAASATRHNRRVFSFVLVRQGDTAYYIGDVATLAAGERVDMIDRKTRQPLVPTLAYTPSGMVPFDFLSLLSRVAHDTASRPTS